MSRQYAKQLLFEVKYSTIYLQIAALCAGLSLVVIMLIQNHYLQFATFLSLVFLMFFALKNNKARELQWQPTGDWLITEKNSQLVGELQSGSVVTHFFAALNFTLENNKKIYVILFQDNIEVEKFRQLRVRMKVEGISVKPRL